MYRITPVVVAAKQFHGILLRNQGDLCYNFVDPAWTAAMAIPSPETSQISNPSARHEVSP
jgi:hypothetical protein